VKVLVVNNMAPFSWGGAEELAVHLEAALVLAGHEAEVLRIPFQTDPWMRIPSQMLLVHALELHNVDRVIALKFPAYLIRHPQKTLWLLHQYRQAYDLSDVGMSDIHLGKQAADLRRVIASADEEAFRSSQRIFVISEITQARLAKNNGVDAEVLRPPLNNPEALALTPGSIRLVIAGPPDAPKDGERLQRLVEAHELGDRVTLDLRFLPRGEVADYVNHATAVACLPYDEDSVSYVAMEGSAAGKPLITTSDSGGVLALARHLETAWVAAPDAASLAEGLSRLGTESPASLRMGAAARALWTSMEVTWPDAVERLLA
jgi:glycosyltransferase involved in cell wall biosynthesis